MPARLAFTAAAYGAGYGILPVCWIILPVIFLYDLTVQTGRFVTLQQSLTGITADSRLQLLLIAFALGSFFEGTSGFGTPVAVCCAILISLGFRPLQAAGLSLLANTAPVAFGAMGIPIVALHGVTGLDLFALTRTTAVILFPFDILVPFWLIWAFAGFAAMIEVWPAILVAGVTFATAQLLMAIWSGPLLVAIVAAAATIVVLVVFLRFWQPKRTLNVNREDITGHARQAHGHTAATIFKAWLPWLVLSVVVFAWGLPRFSSWMDAKTTIKIPITGLHNVVLRVPPVVAAPTPEPAVFNLNWLSATGTGILFAALLAGLLMGLGPAQLARAFFRTIYKIRYTLVTIAAMMADRLPHALLRTRRDHRSGVRAHRPALSLLRHAHRMARHRQHRFRHLLQRPFRQPAANDRPPDRRRSHPHGLSQRRRRRHGQNDRRAQRRCRQHRRTNLRPGRLHPPFRLPAQPRSRRPRRNLRLSPGLRPPPRRPRSRTNLQPLRQIAQRIVAPCPIHSPDSRANGCDSTYPPIPILAPHSDPLRHPRRTPKFLREFFSCTLSPQRC